MHELPDPRGSQVILIGATDYEHLEALPAVRNNLTDLFSCLRDADLWGVPADNCHLLLNVADPAAVGRTVRQAAGAVGVDGALLVYYGGHGLIDPTDGALILALTGCEPEVPHEAGLPYEWIRRYVTGSAARRRVVILDCCYAGRASRDMAGSGSPTGAVADQAETEDACLLVSAPANRPAAAPAGARHTAFTGELIHTLRSGVPGGPALLTVETVWREVRQALLAKGFERPELRARNLGANVALVRNVAVRQRDLTGTVLVAGAAVTDADLHQTAVLVLRHNETGAIGVRLNRPMDSLPPEFSDAWRVLVTEPAVVFDGGPVARDGFIAVALLRPQAVPPLRFVALRNRLGLVSLASAPETLRHTFRGVRIFSGYLGWGPGELEAYLDSGLLRVTDAPVTSVLSHRPATLWPQPENHH